MGKTIFYSWQSDRPADVTRDFIREALEEAVKIINQDIDVEEAMRVTSDTQDEPGHPSIFDTILKKIEEAIVFVPDVSIVGELEGEKSRSRKWVINPNVGIEYGYALKALGTKRIIPIMNTAFGGLKKLPFDMAHRRGPIRYELPENAMSEQRTEKKTELIARLVLALNVLRDRQLLGDDDATEEESDEFEPVAPLEGLEASEFPVPLLGRIGKVTDSNQVEKMVWLRKGPQSFLRLVPTQKTAPLRPLDIRDSIVGGQLTDMQLSQSVGDIWYKRNREGAAVFRVDPDSGERDAAFANSLTQVFTNREIWGVDMVRLDPERSAARTESGQPHIGAVALERQFVSTLLNYMRFARDYLEIQLPIRWVAGLRDIQEHRLLIDHEYSELSYHREVITTGLIEDYAMRADEILMPFFLDVWEEFGLRRPPKQSERLREMASLELDK